MIRVIIVDDMMLDLRALHQLVPWEELGMEVVSKFNNPLKAIEYIQEQDVDILVSDIRMPLMSGIELAEKSRLIQSNLQVIFISGYEDFHYAKKAIEIGAYAYVLKPVNDKELLRALRAVKEKIVSDQEQKRIQINAEKTLPYVRNQLLLDVLAGTADMASVHSMLHEYNFNASHVTVCILEIDDLFLKMKQIDINERNELLSKIREDIILFVEKQGLGEVVKTDINQVTILLNDSAQVGQFEAFIHNTKVKYKLSVTIGAGMVAVGMDQIAESYKQAKEALQLKTYLGKGKILYYSQQQENHIYDAYEIESTFEQIFSSMVAYDLVGIDDGLIIIFQLLRNLKLQVNVYNFSLHILTKLDGYLHSIDEDFYQLLGGDFKLLDVLFQFETIDEIQTWMRRRVFEISEMLHMKKQNKSGRLVEQIENFIMINIENGVSLRNAADHFMFSPSYLGQLFKEQREETLINFIIRKRLEKACELLKDTSLKVYEVAYRLKYRNLNYFIRQFKDAFKMTPGEYRKHL
ncbi:MAG: response regulator [Gorillibacterium sp.]|nr:response regulator [Gorillibacterium sp.]